MKHLDDALIQAKEWSMDDRNNIGEAVVCQSPAEQKRGDFYICSDISAEEWVVARFIDGKRVK